MNIHMRGTLSALLVAGSILAFSSVPAAAQTTGSESFDGSIVTSGTSGTRVELASVIRLRGVFNGVGRIVELQNYPDDPDNASRDDLVFAEGTIHIISYIGDVLSFSFNPGSCTIRGSVKQTTTVLGGTKLFAGATGNFDDVGSIHGRVDHSADGGCNVDLTAPLLHEIDTLSGSGSLSF